MRLRALERRDRRVRREKLYHEATKEDTKDTKKTERPPPRSGGRCEESRNTNPCNPRLVCGCGSLHTASGPATPARRSLQSLRALRFLRLAVVFFVFFVRLVLLSVSCFRGCVYVISASSTVSAFKPSSFSCFSCVRVFVCFRVFVFSWLPFVISIRAIAQAWRRTCCPSASE